MTVSESAKIAKKASVLLASCTTKEKNDALKEIAIELAKRKEDVINANKIDLKRSLEEGVAEPLLKRLNFDEKKLKETIDGIYALISLEDPVGKTLLARQLDEGLELYKVSCPIGVIGVIFESRPDALVQISTLCLKSGNSVLLKGGSEARNTNGILAEIIAKATREKDIPEGWIHLLETRTDVNEMLKLDEYVDLIIPRGSNEFVRYIMDNSRIPVLGHAGGICHCYIHEDADLNMAIRIVADSKTQYVAVCNAVETLLVHENIAEAFLPVLKHELDKRGVVIIGCDKTRKFITAMEASEEDWKTEYLDLKLSVKVVKSISEAVDHINMYGSHHTDSIVAKSKEAASFFMNMVDSANVFWNCSTRFSDGYRYGFGAEVGISTTKIHARGPVGLDGMVIYKYKLIGSGHIVDDYASKRKSFSHVDLVKKSPV